MCICISRNMTLLIRFQTKDRKEENGRFSFNGSVHER